MFNNKDNKKDAKNLKKTSWAASKFPKSVSRGEISEDRFAPEDSGLGMTKVRRAVRLLGFCRQRIAVTFQREEALLIHRRAARALEQADVVGCAQAALVPVSGSPYVLRLLD